jgi:hypothetical protein
LREIYEFVLFNLAQSKESHFRPDVLESLQRVLVVRLMGVKAVIFLLHFGYEVV